MTERDLPQVSIAPTPDTLVLPHRLLSTDKAARLMDLKPRRLRKLARGGYIQCKLVHGHYYFRLDWITEYLSPTRDIELGAKRRTSEHAGQDTAEPTIPVTTASNLQPPERSTS